jgi:hypothetical protein
MTCHVRRLMLATKTFWRLPLAERVVGGGLAAFVAFLTFIAGLVVLFDRVSATKGQSTRAWAVSLIGLALCAALGLGVGAAMLCAFNRLRRYAGDSTWSFIASALAATAGAIVLLSIVLAGRTH